MIRRAAIIFHFICYRLHCARNTFALNIHAVCKFGISVRKSRDIFIVVARVLLFRLSLAVI